MNIAKIIRAWQDREYRESLSEEERAQLPENPVGQFELTEAELTEITGAASTRTGPGCGQSGGSVGCNSKKCTNGNSNTPKCSTCG